MPLTLTLTEGVLPKGTEAQAIQELSDALLERHGLTGNTVMTPNITATLHVLPKNQTFSAGKPFAGAWVEWKVPSFALADRDVQKAYFNDATDIIQKLSGNQQPRENIYVNVVHSVDGGWNLGGQAMTNEELGQAIAQG